ncbi:MAG TPA: type II toxin-antitoxin system HicB family antitoxin [Campylobacterales bacterium]|nr:type II toxin-antitoxin system HicB family antitoxin [Campylobacterales bacterium]
MQNIKYVVYKDGDYYVSQCLNVDVSSFGESIEEAIENLKEALELYFEDGEALNNCIQIGHILLGESVINA